MLLLNNIYHVIYINISNNIHHCKSNDFFLKNKKNKKKDVLN